MAEVLLFHHAQGQTPGFLAFADELRASGNTVHAPDLYEGQTFAALDDGVGYAKQVGFDTILERGRLAAESLPDELVYAGFSLGVMPAQMLAQTRPGAKGALLFSAAFPASEFGGSWQQGVPPSVGPRRHWPPYTLNGPDMYGPAWIRTRDTRIMSPLL
jgi:esterase/lipase